jgi:hypothetical protein
MLGNPPSAHAAIVGLEPYPPIVSMLMATVLMPVSALLLFAAAIRGRWERKHRAAEAAAEKVPR